MLDLHKVSEGMHQQQGHAKLHPSALFARMLQKIHQSKHAPHRWSSLCFHESTCLSTSFKLFSTCLKCPEHSAVATAHLLPCWCQIHTHAALHKANVHKTNVYICAGGCAYSCAVVLLELAPVLVRILLGFYQALQNTISLGRYI